MSSITEASELPLPRLSEASSSCVSFLTDDALFDACGTRIAFTRRTGGASVGPYGSLNLGSHVGDDPVAVSQNRALLACALGADGAALAVPNQVHGEHVVLIGRDGVSAALSGELAEGCDAVVCLASMQPVALCFADCTPVIIVAPGGAFAIVHAGWRGALASLPGTAAMRLAREVGVCPSTLNAYVGPHIGACCYEVSQELLDSFVERFGQSCDAGARHLSLSAAVAASLVAAGVEAERIVDALADPADSGCTCCNAARYYSYRAAGGITGRHSAAACRVC